MGSNLPRVFGGRWLRLCRGVLQAGIRHVRGGGLPWGWPQPAPSFCQRDPQLQLSLTTQGQFSVMVAEAG